MSFSDWLSGELQECAIDLGTLTILTGISPSYLSLLKNGKKSNPSREIVESIALAFAEKRNVPASPLVQAALLAAGLSETPQGVRRIGSLHFGREAGNPDAVAMAEYDVGMRTLEYLLDRERESKEVWIVRSNTFFLSGVDETTRSHMMNLLETTDLHFYFLFRSTGSYSPPPGAWLEPSNNPARDSFAVFKKALLDREEELSASGEATELQKSISKRAHGCGIEGMPEQLALGLGMTYAATVILVYRDESQHRRKFDILSEMYIAVYDPKTKERYDKEHLAWLELPPRRCQTLWNLWEPIMRSVRERKHKEFLEDPDEARQFRPGQIDCSTYWTADLTKL